MGTFSRLRYVFAANVNALIEKAEDPEKLLRSLIREMEEASEEARIASAEMLAEQKHLDRLTAQLTLESDQWQGRAEKAVREERDDLAKAALKARAEVLGRNDLVLQDLTRLAERIEHMEKDITTLNNKMSEAKLKLKSSYSNAAVSSTHRMPARPALSPYERRLQQALGRFDRLQAQVENLEARVSSYEVGGTTPSVWNSTNQETDTAVEEELQRLKRGIEQAAKPDMHEAAA